MAHRPRYSPPFRGKKRDPSKLRDVLFGKSLGNLPIGEKLAEYKLFQSWDRAVGDGIARRTRPVRLIGKTLHVNVSSQSWMNEMMYQRADIIERINAMLGEEVIGDITFKPGKVTSDMREKKAPSPPPAPKHEITTSERSFIEDTVKDIEDDSIKETVRRAMEKSRG